MTVDVLSLVAAYHLRGRASEAFAFREGSEEAMLLKLHLRANHLRAAAAGWAPRVQADGLATATSPVLADWIDKTADNMARWIRQATAAERWVPAAGAEVGCKYG